MRSICVLSCGAVVVLGIAGQLDVAQGGEIYKTVDAQGRVVYSDDPGASGDSHASVDVGSTDSDSDGDVRADQPPPILVDEEQPPSPGDDYVWAPGYWASSDDGYYWVPGSWERAPEEGWLWTPGYWAYDSNYYVFHRGYWGRHIGYYGGINYGHGYPGNGSPGRRVSYNGGGGGTSAVMTANERAAAAERHVPATESQQRGVRAASRTADRVPRAQPTMRSTPIVRPQAQPILQHPSEQAHADTVAAHGPAQTTTQREHASQTLQRSPEAPSRAPPAATPTPSPSLPSVQMPSH